MNLPFEDLIPFEKFHELIGKDVMLGSYNSEKKLFENCVPAVILKIEDNYCDMKGRLLITFLVEGRQNKNDYWKEKWEGTRIGGNGGILWYPGSYSNKGLKNCFNCNCPTEMKRDFSTMEVREFCPRCKR